ncbi:ATP-binding protein [Candidatus Woesearchaeota archaeon]|nr:ATP-binding protein [Candidatus Woesearchaeota archaeon]
MLIIERPQELKKITQIKKWLLIYGRRKTGKTYLISTFLKPDEYFFIKSNKNILTKNNESISYETFIEIVKRSLANNKIVAVDEFHRLGTDFFDFLHYTEKKGKLILISSTLYLSKKLLSEKSALLGLFAEVVIGLISLQDILKALGKYNLPKKELFEIAILLREPIAIDYFDERKKARETAAIIIESSLRTIPALMGEIFIEEQREISAVYEGILRGIAIGKINSGELSSYLFSKRLLMKDDPSIIQQYLNNLMQFGIIKRIELFTKKRFVYKLTSPLARIYYYSDEKYNISERKMNEKELLAIIDELMPRIVEDTVREELAEKEGLRETIVESADFEIDGCLLKFKTPEIALEVKWKDSTKLNINEINNKLKEIDAKKRVLFVSDKKTVKNNGLIIMDPADL